MRTFVNQPASDYYSTGYTLNVPNNGQFAKVIVVTPKGNTIELIPNAGSAFMVIPVNSVPSATNFLRLGRQLVSGSTSDPKAMDTVVAFSEEAWTDAQLTAIPQQGVWTFKYFLTGNATATPNATQTYKTRARAMSVAEFKAQPLAKLNDDVIAQIKLESGSLGYIDLGADASPTIGLEWNVPTGALAPTGLTGFGRFGAAAWDDSINVPSTARKGDIPCSPQSGADLHCTGTAPNLIYASGARLNSVHLRARDPFGRDYTQFYAFYKPVMP